MSGKLLVIGAALVLGAAAAGYHLGQQRPLPVGEAKARPSAAPGSAQAQALGALLAGAQAQARGEGRVDPGPLRAELRQVVREELQALRAELPAAPAAEQAPRRPAEVTPEEARRMEEARRSSQQLLQTARSTRRWTREQAAELRALMPQLDAPQRDEVLRELIPAINRGEVKLAYSGMPF